MVDLDSETVDVLEDIAKLAGVTPSDVINVMLSTKVYNDKVSKVLDAAPWHISSPSAEEWTMKKTNGKKVIQKKKIRI